jgi:cellobiose-specific phosphotransferase system component IIB
MCVVCFGPLLHTKLHKIQQVIEHYTNEKINCEVIDLNGYKTMKGKNI